MNVSNTSGFSGSVLLWGSDLVRNRTQACAHSTKPQHATIQLGGQLELGRRQKAKVTNDRVVSSESAVAAGLRVKTAHADGTRYQRLKARLDLSSGPSHNAK